MPTYSGAVSISFANIGPTTLYNGGFGGFSMNTSIFECPDNASVEFEFRAIFYNVGGTGSVTYVVQGYNPQTASYYTRSPTGDPFGGALAFTGAGYSYFDVDRNANKLILWPKDRIFFTTGSITNGGLVSVQARYKILESGF